MIPDGLSPIALCPSRLFTSHQASNSPGLDGKKSRPWYDVGKPNFHHVLTLFPEYRNQPGSVMNHGGLNMDRPLGCSGTEASSQRETSPPPPLALARLTYLASSIHQSGFLDGGGRSTVKRADTFTSLFLYLAQPTWSIVDYVMWTGLLAARGQEADANGDRSRKLQRELDSTRRDAEGMLQVD